MIFDVEEVTKDFINTLYQENNPIYDDNFHSLGTIQDNSDMLFKDLLKCKTGITFIKDETYLDLYLEVLVEYVLTELDEYIYEHQLETTPEELLETIDQNDYLKEDYDNYTLERLNA